MQPNKRIVVVAGEESGDFHAATFIKKLKARHENLLISGIGGKHMQEAGAELISDLARYGVTGISEVLRHAKVIKQAFKKIKDHLQTNKPDLLVLVDYPGFNLRLAKYAKSVLGIRILYYISPQVWAWKANRIQVIRECIDQMAVILPFEKNLYENAAVPVSFVGHPLVDDLKTCDSSPAIRNTLDLPQNQRLIAMLPGSRINEIERHMPVLKETALSLYKQFNDLQFVIPIAGTISPDLITKYFKDTQIPITFIQGKAREVMSCSDFVIVASGTASLEAALLEKPMCIIYKSSTLTYLAAAKFMKVNYLGLCNLLQNKMIVPELLQYDCNPVELTRTVIDLLQDNDLSQQMISRLKELKLSLSSQQADCSIDQLIEQEVSPF